MIQLKKFFLWGEFIYNFVMLRHKVNINGFCVIHRFKNSKIEFGNNVTLNNSFYSNLIGLTQPCIIIARDEGAITIGDNVGISGSTIYATNSITIGNNTVIGANSKIIDNDFHPLTISERNRKPMDRKSIQSKPIQIASNCFIGTNSIILKGTIIAEGCVIGAGSVVSGTFDTPNMMIAGNPARAIRPIEN